MCEVGAWWCEFTGFVAVAEEGEVTVAPDNVREIFFPFLFFLGGSHGKEGSKANVVVLTQQSTWLKSG